MARHGIHPKAAQELARHSTITLTMDHDTHLRLNDRRAALESLPSLPIDGPDAAQQTLAATGTDDPLPSLALACAKGDENGDSATPIAKTASPGKAVPGEKKRRNCDV